MYPGMRLAPVVAAAPAAGPLAPVVAAVGILATIFAGGLFARHDHWNKQIKPQLWANVQATGKATYAAWYGQVLGVDTSGRQVTLGSYSTLEEAERILQKAADAMGEIYALWYGVMRLFSPGDGVLPGEGTGGAKSSSSPNLRTLGWIALAGAGVYALTRK